jgi:hypothetical protein
MNRKTLRLSSLIALVWGAICLSVAYVAAPLAGRPSLYTWLNQLGPILTLFGCLYVAASLARHNSAAVWSPVPWFLIACAAYYGFGPLSYYYATPETVSFMQLDFPLDERQILFTNLLNSIGIGAVAVGVLVMEHVILPHQVPCPPTDSNQETVVALWLFLTIGACVKYLFTLPHALGLLPYVLPGSIQHLAGLLNGAIILSIRSVHQGRRHYRWVLYPLLASEFVSGLMTFSKTELLTTALATVLGIYLCRQSVRVLLASGIAVVVLYVTVLAPFVIFARNNFSSLGVTEVADLQTTVEAYSRVGDEVQALTMPEVQIWWARLNYAPDQGFAMDAYERGMIGQTVNLLPYIFVPRLLYPEKPSMNSGREFTELITGQEATSSTALGLFGETYWNGGWLLVLVVCIYVGMLFAVFTRFSAHVVAGERFLFVPIVFSGIMTGLFPDGWVVSTFFGGVLEIFVLYLILSVVRVWALVRPMTTTQLTTI